MNTEELKKILDEMNYIYDIFDEVRNLYHNIQNKDDIYNLYNNDDLALLDKISTMCRNIVCYNMVCYDLLYKESVKMGNELYCGEIIKTYNTMTKENNSLKEALILPSNDFYTHDCKRYIHSVKNNLNEILQNTETI